MRVRETTATAAPVSVHYSYKRYQYGTYPTCTRTLIQNTQKDGTYIPSYYYKRIQDVVTPDFKKRMKKGEIINNPLDILTYRANATPLSWDYHFLNVPYQNRCPTRDDEGYAKVNLESTYGSAKSLATYGTLPNIDVQRLKDLAIAQAFANVDVSEAALWATLGELEETVTGLVSLFKRLLGLYGKLRRKEYGLILKQALTYENVSNLYMEFRYGLRPLYYDCKQLYAAWSAIVNKKIPRTTFRSRESESKETNSDTVIIVNDVIRCHKTTSIHRDVTVSAGVLTDIEVANPLQILGLDKSIEAVWELIPYSFVIDWFFNVGTTIAAWTPNAGIRCLASWVCVEDTCTCSLNIGSPFGAGTNTYETISDYSGNLSMVYKHYTREPNPSKPILPSFDMKLDHLKLVDLSIMLSQLLPMKRWLGNRRPHYTD